MLNCPVKEDFLCTICLELGNVAISLKVSDFSMNNGFTDPLVL